LTPELPADEETEPPAGVDRLAPAFTPNRVEAFPPKDELKLAPEVEIGFEASEFEIAPAWERIFSRPGLLEMAVSSGRICSMLICKFANKGCSSNGNMLVPNWLVMPIPANPLVEAKLLVGVSLPRILLALRLTLALVNPGKPGAVGDAGNPG